MAVRRGTIAPAIKTNSKLWQQWYRLSKSDDPKVAALANEAIAHSEAISNLTYRFLCPEG